MSATLQRAGQPHPGQRRAQRRAATPSSAGSWLAFCALAIYGALRWGTMVGSSQQGRLLISLVVTLMLAALTRRLLGIARRVEVGVVTVLAAILLIALAGFPVSIHLAALGSALGDGIGSLPGVLVPYTGSDPNTGAALVLGGAALLLLGAVLFGCTRRSPATAMLALSAIPLTALAVVPSIIVQPHAVYLHGLITCLLVGFFVLAPRVRPERRGSAGALLITATALGAVAAGAIAGDHLWVRVATGHPLTEPAISLGSTSGLAEQFDWQQTYGTQGWPYTGQTVATIQAKRVAYWKAEDLDIFNGSAWTSNDGSTDDGLEGVDASAIATYSETLTVHLAQIFSNQIIAAGYADKPELFGATPGFDPGTWVTNPPLQPGQSYQVRVYDPNPPADELAAAGTDYPAAIAPFTQYTADANVYSGVSALAKRLALGANSPYAIVESILNYLQRGYVYTLDPPSGGSDPLVTFLLHTKRGYCQQFAGAMALMLRMDGVPARVAVGFSPGQNKQGTDHYVVADEDAHAWVEVFFPGFGWVTVDPTPGRATTTGTAPAGVGPTSGAVTHPITSSPVNTATTRAPTGADRLNGSETGAPGQRLNAQHPGAGDTPWLIAVAVILTVALCGLARLVLRSLARRPTTQELTDELERAFARCGRPLADDVTLSSLARNVADSPAAAGYVRALAGARFAAQGPVPTAAGRAGLRRWLAHGLGIGGRLRALRALPPRRAGQLTSP